MLLKHPDVREAAVVGMADVQRGQIPKAYIVSDRRGPEFAREIQEFCPSAAEPARVSAAGRVPWRASQDVGREGRPQGAPGATRLVSRF